MAHTGAVGSDSTHTCMRARTGKEVVTGDLREADMNLSPVCFGSHGNKIEWGGIWAVECLHLSLPLGKHSYTMIAVRERKCASWVRAFIMFGWRLKVGSYTSQLPPCMSAIRCMTRAVLNCDLFWHKSLAHALHLTIFCYFALLQLELLVTINIEIYCY